MPWFAHYLGHMSTVINPLARVALCAASIALLSACGSSSPGGAATVTVTSSGSPTAPATGSSPASGSAVAPSPGVSPSNLTKLSGTCDTLLPDSAVTEALGVAQLVGDDSFVVGQPEKDIGRIAYLNCRYGLRGKGAAAIPKVEIGVSLYTTAAKAAIRISATGDDYAAHGAMSADVTVDGLPGKLFTGGVGTGYEVPLLVVASGQRTVAVSVATSVATGDKVTKASTDLATLALKRTGG